MLFWEHLADEAMPTVDVAIGIGVVSDPVSELGHLHLRCVNLGHQLLIPHRCIKLRPSRLLPESSRLLRPRPSRLLPESGIINIAIGISWII